MLVFGTRPEAVKMAPVIMEISKRPGLRSITVSTGQHKEMLRQVLLDFDLQDSIDHELSLMSQGQTLSELSARAITSISSIISTECPDVVLVQGDTTTALMAALAAFYAKVHVGHIEAGLRTHAIYAPFPEEVNRQSISTMSTFNFAPTELAAENLRSEGRSKNVFVTGNTVVDALKIMQDRPRSKFISDVLKVAESRVLLRPPKVILLTAHRRENLGRPLMNIFGAVSDLLRIHEDVVVIYPIHLNPEVASAARERFGEISFNKLQAGDKFDSGTNDEHLNRLLLIPPVHHADLVALLQICNFVMTDSGGIQEEGITLGKPVLVLRDTTERPEGVLAGVSKLVGTNRNIILEWAEKLLSDDVVFGQMSNSNQLFGDGTAGKQIVDLLQNFSSTLSKFEDVSKSVRVDSPPASKDVYDLVVLLTVWKRNTTETILDMIRQQSALDRGRIAVLLFQNGDHADITSIVERWKQRSKWSPNNVDLLHVFSKVETGYYGRFLGPLLVQSSADSSFILLDDDIILGNRYFENMLRVVSEGHLATRNGRFLDRETNEYDMRRSWIEGPVDTFNEDDAYDFGGHIWAGKMEWLRIAWRQPSPVLYNAENFWISAVLQHSLGIGTKRPRCPSPGPDSDIEMCACIMRVAHAHIPSELGANVVDEGQQSRHQLQSLARSIHGRAPWGVLVDAVGHLVLVPTIIGDDAVNHRVLEAPELIQPILEKCKSAPRHFRCALHPRRGPRLYET